MNTVCIYIQTYSKNIFTYLIVARQKLSGQDTGKIMVNKIISDQGSKAWSLGDFTYQYGAQSDCSGPTGGRNWGLTGCNVASESVYSLALLKYAE